MKVFLQLPENFIDLFSLLQDNKYNTKNSS